MKLDLNQILGAVIAALLLAVGGQELRVRAAGETAAVEAETQTETRLGSQCAHVVEAMAEDRAKLEAGKRMAWCRARTAIRAAVACGWTEPTREQWKATWAPREDEARDWSPGALAEATR